MTDQDPSDTDIRLSVITDRSLIRRFRDGEDDAATALYVRYARRLQALASGKTGSQLAVHADPEGIVQSVFRTFFRRAAVGQYDAANGDDLWKLFLVIALNKIRTSAAHFHAKKRDISRTSQIQDDYSNTGLSDEHALTLLQMTIDELLAELPGNQSEIIVLRIDGHDIETIANKTNRSKRSVERILQRFRADLRARLDAGD